MSPILRVPERLAVHQVRAVDGYPNTPDPLHVEVDTHDLDDLEATIAREGANSIAAFVAEPVIATIEIIESEGLVANSRTVALERLRAAFGGHPDIAEVRGAGLMAEVGWRRGDLSATELIEQTERVSRRAFHGGLIVRSTGDTTMLAPPLCTTRADVDEIVSTLQTAAAQEA